MKAMTLNKFNKLFQKDFKNGAILDEIRQALKEREKFIKLIDMLLENPHPQVVSWANTYFKRLAEISSWYTYDSDNKYKKVAQILAKRLKFYRFRCKECKRLNADKN